MKIDEPKTPYVTDEEFRRLCDEDPDYKEDQKDGSVELRSDQAENDQDDDVMADFQAIMNQEQMQQLNDYAMISDEDNQNPSEMLMGGTTKKVRKHQTVLRDNSFQIPQSGLNGKLEFSIDDLADRLGGIKEEDDETERRKKEFEAKRKKHYAEEFNMAQLLKKGK